MRCRQCHMPLFSASETACTTCGRRPLPAEPEAADVRRLDTVMEQCWQGLADPALAECAWQLYALRAPEAPGPDPGSALTDMELSEALALVYTAARTGRHGDAARWLAAAARRDDVGPLETGVRTARLDERFEFSLSADDAGVHLSIRRLPLGDPAQVLTATDDGWPEPAAATLPPLLPDDWAAWTRQLQMEAAAACLLWKALAAPAGAGTSVGAVDAFLREGWQQLQQRLDAVRDGLPEPPPLADLRRRVTERDRGYFRKVQPGLWIAALEQAALDGLSDTAADLRRDWEAALSATLGAWLDSQLARTGRCGLEVLADEARQAVGSVQEQLARLLQTQERLLARARSSLAEGLGEVVRRAAGLAWTLGRTGPLDEPAEQSAALVERLREAHLLRLVEASVSWLGDAMRCAMQEAESALRKREAQVLNLRQGAERALMEWSRWDDRIADGFRLGMQQCAGPWLAIRRPELWGIASPRAEGYEDGASMLRAGVRILEDSWPDLEAPAPEQAACAVAL